MNIFVNDPRDEITLGTKILDGGVSLIPFYPEFHQEIIPSGISPDTDAPGDYDPALDPQYIINTLKQVHQLEIKRKIPIEEKARRCWRLYHSDFNENDAEKDDWMSKRAFPVMFMTTERFVSNFSKLREQNPNWFEVQSLMPGQQVFYNLCKRWNQAMLDHYDVRFSNIEKDFLRNGLITAQTAVMVTFNVDDTPIVSGREASAAEQPLFTDITSLFSDQPAGGAPPASENKFPYTPGPNMPRLHLQTVDPTHLWLDTITGKEQYKIWETILSVGEFLKEAEKLGYDLEKCKRAARAGMPSRIADWIDDEQKNVTQDYTKMGNTRVLLTHFEGTLTCPSTGAIIVDKKYFVMCNEVELVLAPVDTPFWDKKPAIVAAPFIKVANATYGKSPLTENVDAFLTRHDLLNLILDFFQRSLCPAYELEEDRLSPEDGDSLNSVAPGQIIRTMSTGSPNAKGVLTPVTFADLPQGFWQFLQFFQTTFSEFTGMTQELSGMPRTRGRITGMEFSSRQAQAGDVIVEWYKGLETNVYEPLLYLIFLRSLQFSPDEFWKTFVISSIPEIIPKNAKPEEAQKWIKELTACANWTAKERYEKLGGMFRFKVKIFSSLMERQQVIEQATFFLQTVAKIPQMISHVRLEKILLKITTAFGWDPEEVLNLDSVPTPEANIEMIKQMVERGQTELENSPIQTPDLSGGLADYFGLGGSSFGDSAGQDMNGKIDTGSGSPFSGTGAPNNFSPNPLY